MARELRRSRWVWLRRALAVLAIVLTAFVAALALAPLAPELGRLGDASRAVGVAASDVIGGSAMAPARAVLAAALVAALAFPVNSGFRLPGPRALAGPIGALAALLVAAPLALGLGAELVRQAAIDPLAPSAREASIFFGIGYAVGYLDLVDAAFGHILSWLESLWPGFAAVDARLGDEIEAPLSALLYAGFVSLFALAPFWLALGALWLLATRLLLPDGGSWRHGAARLVAAVLATALVLGVFAVLESEAARL